MTDQLELPLEWRVLDVGKCPHTSLRYDGVMFAGEPDAFPLVTCHHPTMPHCGGTFDARKFTRNAAVLHKGHIYSLDRLRDFYGR